MQTHRRAATGRKIITRPRKRKTGIADLEPLGAMVLGVDVFDDV